MGVVVGPPVMMEVGLVKRQTTVNGRIWDSEII